MFSRNPTASFARFTHHDGVALLLYSSELNRWVMERVIATASAVALTLTLFSGIAALQWVAAGAVLIGTPLLYRAVIRRAQSRTIRTHLKILKAEQAKRHEAPHRN